MDLADVHQLSIIRPDNNVAVNRRPLSVDCSSIDPNTSAIQWRNGLGVIEYITPQPNDRFTDISPYQDIINAWEAAAAAADKPKPPLPSDAEQTARRMYSAALNGGITLSWSVSTALNGSYTLNQLNDQSANWLHMTEMGVFPNGSTRQTVLHLDGLTTALMNLTQFKLFMGAALKYLSAAQAAKLSQAGGGTPTWPDPNISVTG